MKMWIFYGVIAAFASALLFPQDGITVMAVILGLFMLIGYLDRLASELQGNNQAI